MFDYLQPADRPVVDTLEACEVIMAKGQEDKYNPLRCLASQAAEGFRLSRWTLTPEQREAVANGADIFLELMTFNQPMNPIRVAVSDNPNPDYFATIYQLVKENDAVKGE